MMGDLCPECGSASCQIAVSYCCRIHGSRERQKRDGYRDGLGCFGHFIELWPVELARDGALDHMIARVVPWHEVLQEFGERALRAAHYGSAVWDNHTLSAVQSADRIESWLARYTTWVAACMHDAPDSQACERCAAVLEELARRGYFTSVSSMPFLTYGTSPDDLVGGTYVRLVVSARNDVERALAQAAVHGAVSVWRAFFLYYPSDRTLTPVFNLPPRYYLRGNYRFWRTGRYEAICTRDVDHPMKPQSREDRLRALSHLRNGLCSCGVYGLYDVRDIDFYHPFHVTVLRRRPSTVEVLPRMVIARCRATGVVAFSVNGVRASEMEIAELYLPVVLPSGHFERPLITDVSAVARDVADSLTAAYGAPVRTVEVPLDGIVAARAGTDIWLRPARARRVLWRVLGDPHLTVPHIIERVAAVVTEWR